MSFDYDSEIIKVDTKLAGTMGGLLWSTRENSPLLAVRYNRHGAFGFQVPDTYDLAIMPVIGRHAGNAYDTAYGFVADAFELVQLVNGREGLEARLVAMSNVMDWRSGTDEKAAALAREALETACHAHQVYMAAGESAVLGQRVVPEYNISGSATMAIPAGRVPEGLYRTEIDGREIEYAVVRHHGKVVVERCDGNGTKLELNMERLLMPREAAVDTAAMAEDDIAKMPLFRYLATVFSVEVGRMRDSFCIEDMAACYRQGIETVAIENRLQLPYAMNWAEATGRVSGYGPCAINANATGMALVEPSVFFNPPMPQDSDLVIAFQSLSNPNVRCNGLSSIRPAIVEHFGDTEYHQTEAGRRLAVQAGQGATKLRELAQELYDAGASHFGHLSGGGWRDKAGRVWASQGLGGVFNVPFEPHPVHTLVAGLWKESAQGLASKFNYCGEGWVTANPDRVGRLRAMLIRDGFGAAVIGQLKSMGEPVTEINFEAVRQTAKYSYEIKR